MTANSEENKNESRPEWAEGLDLTSGRVRAAGHTLKRILSRLDDHNDRGAWRIVLRRLADAEMKLAELQADRGEPDFLIDRDGEAWRRWGPDAYSVINAAGLIEEWSRERIEAKWGPVTEAWRGRK